ncbi:Na+/H+ antiporter [Ilyomonas limi]|uniref:Na+/H+ antiporter n=1 Tax=Ilyomonas limi TaxID=2575867 RepID=A0A4U3LBN2_9BACT|nr:Na+/H+ antiporter [Ilyomonas limi]TKK71456.1 Na+/H+ antiporter [Ilyomonas limi]
MESGLLIIISLLFAVSLLSMLSNRLGIAYPIFLVIAGLIIGITPGIPNLNLDPDLVFIIFLPPLLYSAAWNTSWREFWAYRRSIALLAIGLVFFTSYAIAYISNALITDFPLALGFVLGGIISPPDAVAATSVISRLKVPRRVIGILEGESLVNDASSLTVFRFALVAISSGHFVLGKAVFTFFVIAGGGVFIGLAIAAIIYLLFRYLPTDPAIDTGITLMAPYLMYLSAEHFHCSGVLAVVSGGLFLSYHSSSYFNYDSRLQVQSVWNTLVFLLNGIVFILIGMQLPFIIRGLETYSVSQAIGYAVIISLSTVVIRIVWVFLGSYLPGLLSERIRAEEEKQNWKEVFIIAWSGMRGVVSLAAAFAIPQLLLNGQLFPHRNLILFITFSVILFTLVLQGLSLPLLIKWLKIEGDDVSMSEQKLQLNKQLAEVAIHYLNDHFARELNNNEDYRRIRDRYERIAQQSDQLMSDYRQSKPAKHSIRGIRTASLELIKIQRAQLEEMYSKDEYKEELLRNKEHELDLEEARLRRIGV